MNASQGIGVDERVLVLAPTAADGTLTQSILAEAELAGHTCTTITELCRELSVGAGALLVTDEIITHDDAAPLIAWLAQQPAWSELPTVFLSGRGAESLAVAWALEHLGNVTVLERPVKIFTLVSTLRSALRARRRQYEAREQLAERQRAAESLRASESFNRAILNALPAQIAVLNATGTVLAANEPWLRFALEHHTLAHKSAAVGADYLATWRHAAAAETEVATRALAGLESVLQGRSSRFVLEFSLATPAATRWFLLEVVRAPAEIGGAVVAHFDITERKHAEEALAAANAEAINQRHRLEAIMESLPVGIAITDTKGGKLRSNPAYEQVWGGPVPEVASTQDYEQFRAWWADTGVPLAPSDWASSRAVQFGETVIGQTLKIQRFDGGEAYVLNSAAPIRDAAGFVVGSAVGVQDVTALRRAEELLRDAGLRKDQFLAMLAHELRNPMAAVRSALEVMGQSCGEKSVLKESHDVMERQLRLLTRLVDDLLEVSRINTGRIHLRFEPVNLNAVAQRAIERVRPVVDRRRQSLALTLAAQPLWLNADAARLEQVLGNLLDNASKYSESGSTIWLEITTTDEHACIRVRDNGLGITAEELPNIFELFTQVDQSLDRSDGGLGVGLALVKGLVESHGGTVAATSPGLGQGSEFVVRLPLTETAASAAAVAVTPQQENSKSSALRVLVVDDNLDAAKMSAILLDAWGHQVCIVHSGREALERAQSFRPHVILLDIGLPVMDGYEVARRLRQDERFKQVHIVAVSGYGRQADRERSQAAGIDVHLVKPVDSAELRRLLESFTPLGV